MENNTELHNEAIATVKAMVVVAEGKQGLGSKDSLHPVDVWKYVLSVLEGGNDE